MLLSMPTTSSPFSWKNLAVSLPIRPEEPVITATDIRQDLSCRFGVFVESFAPRGGFLRTLLKWKCRRFAAGAQATPPARPQGFDCAAARDALCYPFELSRPGLTGSQELLLPYE